MEKIYILKNGLAVKLPLNLFEDLIVDIDGFLVGFKYKKNGNLVAYNFYYGSEFKNERYQNKSFVPDGYYEEIKVLQYFAYKQSTAFSSSVVPTPVEMKQLYNFNYVDFYNNYTPLINDEVTVETINSTLPDFIYEENKATFKIINDLEGNLKRYYLNSRGKIDFPIESTISNGFVSYELVQNNYLNSPNPKYVSLGHFYHKNFDERRNAWLITKDKTQDFDRITTLIVLRIRQIIDDIFPLFLDTFNWNEVDSVGFQMAGYDESFLNTDLKKTLYEIKKGWAFYYVPTSTNPNLNTYQAILPSQADYEAFQKYYLALTNFYTNCYRVKLQFVNKTEAEKLELLIKCLPASALNVIPLQQRINLLISLAKGKIFEDKENLVLKIIQSIDPSDATTFLYKLEKTIIYEGEESYSLYEALYNKINDQILWFGKDNRKILMLQLFKLWYVSAYNPSLETGDFTDITNQDLDDIETALLGYQSNAVLLNYNAEKFFGFYTDNMNFIFSNRKIKVREEKTRIVQTYNPHSSPVQTYWETVGEYNFFQAISLADYKENDVAIKIPLVDLNQDGQNINALLPLFFLKYMDDYGDSEDVWTGIGLTFDVALTFTGVGNISKLRHLRHLGKFGRAYRAYRAGNTSAEVVFTVKALWTATQGVAAAFEITASLLSIYLEYYTNSCNNYKTDVTTNINDLTPNGQLPDDSQESDEYKRCKSVDRILFWIQIGSLGLDLYASKMIKKHSKELELLGFPPEWDLPQYIALKNNFQELNNLQVDNYFNFINQIPVAYKDIIGNKLLTYDDSVKLNFLEDFGSTTQTEAFWELMAKNGAEAVENWKNLFINGAEIERKLLAYLENTDLANSLIRYYQESNLRNILQKLDELVKQKFLKQFGSNELINQNLFDKMVQKPKKMDLLVESLNSIKKGQKDYLDVNEILDIIDSDLSDVIIDLLRIKNKYLLKQLTKIFRKEINNIDISINRLRDIQNGDAFTFFSSLSNNKKRKFESANKLLVKMQIYNDDIPIGGVLEQNYLSGREEFVSSIFNNGLLVENFIEPSNYTKFNVFKKNAFDLDDLDRFNDTELKFIFNFLENNWNTGNKFVIEMESTLYSCSSCQGYLLYLNELAKENGKIIQISIKADKRAIGYKELMNNVLNP